MIVASAPIIRVVQNQRNFDKYLLKMNIRGSLADDGDFKLYGVNITLGTTTSLRHEKIQSM
jgi:hypothetical protein